MVVRERVASKEKDLVVVERPVFHLANAIARAHDLRYSYIDVPGKQKDCKRRLPLSRAGRCALLSRGD